MSLPFHFLKRHYYGQFLKKLNCDVDITSQDDMNQVHKYIERLKNRKGAGE